MVIQIYSMTSIADAIATAEAGADLVGVVVAEPGVVAEGIEAVAARGILAAVRPRARGVALSLADDRDEICAMVDAVRPDIVHIAAREIEPEDCAWIRKRVAPVRLLRAIAVRAGETIAEADAHQEAADYLMLDSGAKGATGETHDWSVSRAVVERSRIPVILAGGLSADNVARAIAAVRPWGVDSFTHTDVPGNRGKKDPARVRAFIAAALRGFADSDRELGFHEAKLLEPRAGFIGVVRMHHQARRHRSGAAEHPRGVVVEDEGLDSAAIEQVVRHPHLHRINAGEDFGQIVRIQLVCHG